MGMVAAIILSLFLGETSFSDSGMEAACEGPESVSIPEIQLRPTRSDGTPTGQVGAAASIETYRNHYYWDDGEWGIKRREKSVRVTWVGDKLVIESMRVRLPKRLIVPAGRLCTDQFQILKIRLNTSDNAPKVHPDLATREIYFTSGSETSENHFPLPAQPIKMNLVLSNLESKSVRSIRSLKTEDATSKTPSCVATHIAQDSENRSVYLSAPDRFGISASLTKSNDGVVVFGSYAPVMFNGGKTSCGSFGVHQLFYVESVQISGR